MRTDPWPKIEGEKVIYSDSVAVNPWKALLLRGKYIRVTIHRILVDGLPEIPLKSITGCEVRNYWLMTPYVHLENLDGIGNPALLEIMDHEIKFTDQRLEHVKRLREVITKAWQDSR